MLKCAYKYKGEPENGFGFLISGDKRAERQQHYSHYGEEIPDIKDITNRFTRVQRFLL